MRRDPLRQDESGVVAVVTALALTVLLGSAGLAVDLGMWYRDSRLLQNASDAAAIAAALNGSASYQTEAKAVARQYGFVDGVNGITVTALNNQTCPGGGTDCYRVTIAQASPPRFFSSVVGNFSPHLAGSAIAGGSQTHSYCLLALAGSNFDPGIRGNGVPAANLDNCSIMSNTGMTCNGHNTGATFGDAHGTNNGCGINERSNVPAVADPYAGLASNIPANPCTSYAGVTWPSGAKTLTDPPTKANGQIVCGTLRLNGDVTLTTSAPGSLLVIENGQLDTNGHTLRTAPGSALTIIFSGTVGSYTHTPTGGGILDFNGPSSGPWSGVAIYQDPALTTGVDISAAGNSPTWDISGLVYLPHASVVFSGAVNKSSNGASCFGLVVDHIRIDGTGEILKTGGCAAAGLTLPTNNVGPIALLQ
jgi:hypothetical protein